MNDLFSCDGCDRVVPRSQIRTVMAYGCEGDFCRTCRHADDEEETGTWTVTEFPERSTQLKSLSEVQSERDNAA